jgi:dipeptidyl aminopeptidase/acylaminoacyl peptidase
VTDTGIRPGWGRRASVVMQVAFALSRTTIDAHIQPWLRCLLAVALLALDLQAAQSGAPRPFRPEDLFQVRQIGATAWSPDGRYVTVELTRPRPWLDAVPASDIVLLDVRTRVLRPLSSRSTRYLGFFGAVWSPDGRRVAFLSVEADATARLWMWTAGTATPALVPNIDVRLGLGDPSIAWIDGHRIAVTTWETGAAKTGPLYYRLLRGRNVADAWSRAADGRVAAVSVLESGRVPAPPAPAARLVVLDVRGGALKTLARGRIHRLAVSPDGCCVSFLRESRGNPGEPVAPYFEQAQRANNVEAGYAAVNWGTERHVLDAGSGVEIAASAPPPPPQPSPTIDPAPPRSDARQVSVSPTGEAALYAAHGADGSRLWISGGGGRPLTSSLEIWRGNEWMRQIRPGRAESLSYADASGRQVTAWLLLPPDYVVGTKAPLVTIVYPGTVYGAAAPSSFSTFHTRVDHPQLFAALGYAVLLPSMPAPADPADSHALAPLLSGVMPAVDAAIARGVADPDRIAVAGHSDGGFAVLGLIAQTRRFRSAIASAGFSDFISLYGTAHGQYRYGDAATREAAQVLRMLQMERGGIGLGGPPWAEPDRYIQNSALLRADEVETPLMLIHGDLDDIPVQQAEEFFTALLRQDKRSTLVRYTAEGHEISGRANVLDLWRRMAAWLSETMAPRR